MLVEFVNHASLLVTAGNVRLISDPWLEGKVFHEGWALMARSVMTFDDFKDITHIWFSHEHPDHFFPDNLKKIPEEYRQKIQVLFQETRDKKVVRYCEAIGFGKVTELRPLEWVQLGDEMRVLNCPCDTNWVANSWLCVRTPTGTLLNLNDCGARGQLGAIKEIVGDVDVLATQFSYAQWVNNIEAVEQRLEHDQLVLQDLKTQIDTIKPRCVIPFASFAWFCTEENFYLNAEKNSIRDVVDFIQQKTRAKPIALYPSDQWIVGQGHDSSQAIAQYERDAAEISDPFQRPRTRHDLVDEKTLIELGKDFRRKLMSLGDPLLVRVHLAWHCYKNRSHQGVPRASNIIQLIGGHVQPARVFVTDLGRAFTFDLRQGLQPSDLTQSSSDISLPSASLAYCLKFPWGGDTLYVNGCFQENDDWKNVGSMIYPNRFFKYCNLLRSVDMGKKLTWSTAAKALVRKWGFRKVGVIHTGYTVSRENI